MKPKKNLNSYLKDSLLIVFSVLFALFINKLADDYTTSKKVKIARESIIQEIEQNILIIEDWKIRHEKISEKLNSLASGKADSLENLLKKELHFDISLLTDGNSLIDAIPTKTAWESAKTTGIISEMGFETTRQLTFLYSLQDIMMDQTIENLLSLYFNTTLETDLAYDIAIVKFKLRFEELTGQEYLLSTLYAEGLKKLKN